MTVDLEGWRDTSDSRVETGRRGSFGLLVLTRERGPTGRRPTTGRTYVPRDPEGRTHETHSRPECPRTSTGKHLDGYPEVKTKDLHLSEGLPGTVGERTPSQPPLPRLPIGVEGTGLAPDSHPTSHLSDPQHLPRPPSPVSSASPDSPTGVPGECPFSSTPLLR